MRPVLTSPSWAFFFFIDPPPMAKSERPALSTLTHRQYAPALVSLKLFEKKRHFMAQMDNVIPIGTSFSSAWKHLYECAMLELDNSKLPERIAAAHRAIV